MSKLLPSCTSKCIFISLTVAFVNTIGWLGYKHIFGMIFTNAPLLNEF